jgi:hypothetical protein
MEVLYPNRHEATRDAEPARFFGSLFLPDGRCADVQPNGPNPDRLRIHLDNGLTLSLTMDQAERLSRDIDNVLAAALHDAGEAVDA